MTVKAYLVTADEACMFGVAKKCPIMNSRHGAGSNPALLKKTTPLLHGTNRIKFSTHRTARNPNKPSENYVSS